jgi:3-hydroxybutyrate dehydrogenase
MAHLNGKIALVTGSTSGIGLGIAKRLAEAGANIVLNGIEDVHTGEAIQKELESTYNVKTIYVQADLSKIEHCENLIDKAANHFGSIDILVNNAGIQFVAPVEEFPTEKWDLVLAINLTSAFHTIRKTLPLMRKSGWGRIINIASAHGLVASEKKAAYVAAKHGLVGLTKVIALETAKENITCNAICPGWVLTPLVQKQIDKIAADKNISVADAEIELLSEKQPSLQFVTPEQVGGLAAFLCSNDAAQITGSQQLIDGAWLAR